MKTNIIFIINKRFAQLFSLCLLATLTACDRDEVGSVDFDVRLQKPETLYTGEIITFEFDGNPDYISFYSGERNNRYDNRERTKMQLDSLGLSHAVLQQYSEGIDYVGKRTLRVMISEDYNGSGTAEAVKAATWRDLTEPNENKELKVAVPDWNVNGGTKMQLDYSAINLSEYKDKQFYIAYRYLADPHTGTKTAGDKYLNPNTGKEAVYSYDNRPRIDVTNLRLVKREPDKNLIAISDMQNDFAFTVVPVTSGTTSTFNIAKASLLFQPKEVENEIKQDYQMDVWMISQKLTPTDVEPDRGTPIKGTNARLPIYQFTYNEPGTYTATFIATNANKWDSKQIVREITFKVVDRPEE